MVGVITLSIVLIFLIHQVYEYLKKSFSKPLERNIVNETKSHYEQIYNTLATSRQIPTQNVVQMPIPSEIYTQPPPPPENMASELMNFMSDLDNRGDAAINVIEDNIQPYEEEIEGISSF